MIKIGIIGCGGIAFGKHLPNLKLLDDVELVAFCDLDVERATKAKDEYGTPDARVYTDYLDLLAEPLDVVHVLTPNNTHATITIAFGSQKACHVREADGQIRIRGS
ncbi:Gfo/Idh/MocA family oxidoreductase [Erysipelothrix sp. D19-032]